MKGKPERETAHIHSINTDMDGLEEIAAAAILFSISRRGPTLHHHYHCFQQLTLDVELDRCYANVSHCRFLCLLFRTRIYSGRGLPQKHLFSATCPLSSVGGKTVCINCSSVTECIFLSRSDRHGAHCSVR